jgi:antitoxin (DNA-binding transcriptional repressor) of toxin-antitoxin stability system
MVEMTVTEFVRKMKSIFDRIEYKGEEVILLRNKHRIARIVPGSAHLTAIEAMGDLYRTLPEDAAAGWVEAGRSKATIKEEKRDPWA